MAATKISDIIIPEIFNAYTIEKSVELDTLVQSGIVTTDAQLDSLATAGGKLINMPGFKGLTGADEVLSDSSALTPDKITTQQDVAALFMRGKSWGVNDLTKALSGSDPMAVIGDMVAGYWAMRRQALLLSELKGIFASGTLTANQLDVSGLAGDLATITGNSFIDALSKLGDNFGKVTAIGMHSAVYAKLKKDNLITTIKPSDNTEIEFYMGKRVVVNDLMPVTAGVYKTYLFGESAFGLGNGSAPVPTEVDRDSLAGEDYLINRNHFLLHPLGIKFTSASVAGSSPTNAEVETGTNWSRVFDPKNIKIVEFAHKIA